MATSEVLGLQDKILCSEREGTDVVLMIHSVNSIVLVFSSQMYLHSIPSGISVVLKDCHHKVVSRSYSFSSLSN